MSSVALCILIVFITVNFIQWSIDRKNAAELNDGLKAFQEKYRHTS